MSASKRIKTLRLTEQKSRIDPDDPENLIYSDRPAALSVRLQETARGIRRSRIRNGGPVRSQGIPAAILAEQSRKKSPRQLRNERMKQEKEEARAKIRNNVRPMVA